MSSFLQLALSKAFSTLRIGIRSFFTAVTGLVVGEGRLGRRFRFRSTTDENMEQSGVE
jgi:hypothetical protein